MNQSLYLVRHCEAEPWSPLGNDFARSLSVNGEKHAKLLSGWMRKNLDRPDTILCSPAKRTRQTLAPTLAAWHQCLATTDYADSMYGAGADLLLNLAQDAFSYSECLLMVGHNPGIESLLKYLVQPVQLNGIGHYAAGTLAVIHFSGRFRPEPGIGKLDQLLSLKDLSFD